MKDIPRIDPQPGEQNHPVADPVQDQPGKQPTEPLCSGRRNPHGHSLATETFATTPLLRTVWVVRSGPRVSGFEGRGSERAPRRLKDIGVKLSLDDFGTGYSSLGYLRRFPVDTVKVDREFVAHLAEDPASHTIVTAVIALAHGLGMTVISEGVETAAQHRELTALGCDSCQGFYFAPPMTAANLDAVIQHHIEGRQWRLNAPSTTNLRTR